MMGALSASPDRLQPADIPYRFFATAVILHIAAWAVLLAGADQVPGFVGGLGPVLAALHLITLGVLAMTAVGAATQLLPMATCRPLGPHWACRLSWWLFAPGVALLAAGMASGWVPGLHGGATLVVLGLSLGGLLMARPLMGLAGQADVARHAWVALASLLALLILGVLLVADFSGGFLADHGAVAAAHAVLAGYGFMGNLAIGFSYVLFPMFVLGQPAPEAVGRRTSALAALALVMAAAGLLNGLGWLAALGGAVALAMLAFYAAALKRIYDKRMRRRLEPFFRLALPGWLLLPVSILAGMALALGAPAGRLTTLWGFLLVFGWLLTAVMGILQRIMPFLASMHSSSSSRKPALLSGLTAKLPLDVHAGAHGLALLLVGAGILLDSPALVRTGAAAGLVGAAAFAAFAVELAKRYRAHRRAYPLPSQT